MTKTELTAFIGKWGKLEFNGRFYPSTIFCYIRVIENGSVTVEIAEGEKRLIEIKGIKSFTEYMDPKR